MYNLKKNLYLFVLLLSFMMISCENDQTAIKQDSSQNIRTQHKQILYSKYWGKEFNKIKLISFSQNPEFYFPKTSNSIVKIDINGNIKELKFDCNVKDVNNTTLLCENEVSSIEGSIKINGIYQNKILSAVLGENQRLLYTLDANGYLSLWDTYSNAKPNDDVPLILYKEYGNTIKIISGNGLKLLKKIKINGNIINIKMNQNGIYVLYENHTKLNITKINLNTWEDYSLLEYELKTSEYPLDFAISEDRVAIIFNDTSNLLLLNLYNLTENIETVSSQPDYVVYLSKSQKFLLLDLKNNKKLFSE